jgi:hypothetical protein
VPADPRIGVGVVHPSAGEDVGAGRELHRARALHHEDLDGARALRANDHHRRRVPRGGRVDAAPGDVGGPLGEPLVKPLQLYP